MQILAAANTPLKQRIAKGEENPEQGWISLSGAERVPAPTVIFSGKNKLPVTIVSLIQPFQAEEQAATRIELTDFSASQIELEVATADILDHWTFELKYVGQGKIESVSVNFSREKDGQQLVQFTKTF